MRHALRITCSTVILSLAVFSLAPTAQGQGGVRNDSVTISVGADAGSAYLPTLPPPTSYCVVVGGIMYCW